MDIRLTGSFYVVNSVHIPSNRVHPALATELFEAFTRVRQRTTEHNNGVVDSTRVPVQYLFGNECPSVDFFRDRRWNSTTALMRDVDVTGTRGWWWHREVDALMQ